MIQSFNLINERWIPCEMQEGEIVELSLRDTLVYAHELKEIHGTTPLETASLYRLLLAVLHRVFGPKDKRAWFSLWQAGQWDSARLDAYFAEWYDRFDILHPDEKRRFYQQKPLEGVPIPIIHLVHSIANPTLFSHLTDMNQPGMTLMQAARAVVTTQVFRPGGFMKGQGGKDRSSKASPGQKGISFLIGGRSLFEGTLLNLWSYSSQAFMQATGIRQTEHDAPAWEQDDPIGAGRSLPLGYLDYLTWQSFRIWLGTPEPDGRIYSAIIGKGQPELADTVFDPFKHYYADKKSGYTPLQFSEDRALWREGAALLENVQVQGGQAATKPPWCIVWLSTLLEEGGYEELKNYGHIPLMALGMASDRAKIDFYRHERMPIPQEYFRSRELVARLNLALDKAEKIAQALDKALYSMAESLIALEADLKDGRKPAPEDVRRLLNHWAIARYYWGSIEPAFWQLVETLPSNGQEALEGWMKALIRVAWGGLEMAEQLAGADGRAFKATARGRAKLADRLGSIQKEMMNNG